MTLGEYMKTNVWRPLGIACMTFHPEQDQNLLASMVDMSVRPGGENRFGTPAKPEAKVAWSEDKMWARNVEDDSGGAGVSVSCLYSEPRIGPNAVVLQNDINTD
jgi:CubicO group peptidase (beta-lactamase class C family)